MFSIAATGIVVSMIHGSKGLLSQYGVLGELVRVGGIGGVFAMSL